MNLANIVQTALDRGAVCYSLSTGEVKGNDHAVSKVTSTIFHLTDEVVANYIKANSVMLSTGDNYLQIHQSGAKWMMSVKDTSVTIKVVKDRDDCFRINCSRDGITLLDILDAMDKCKFRALLMEYLDDNKVMAYAKIGTKYHALGYIPKQTFIDYLKTKRHD